MTSRSRGWFAAGAVTLLTIALAVLDVTDRSLRHWWEDHPFTTCYPGWPWGGTRSPVQ